MFFLVFCLLFFFLLLLLLLLMIFLVGAKIVADLDEEHRRSEGDNRPWTIYEGNWSYLVELKLLRLTRKVIPKYTR